MNRYLLVLFFAFFSTVLMAQNLSYTCPRDTTLGCNTPCITLTAKIPDIKSIGDNYTYQDVTRVSVCRPYDPPATPGPSTSLSIDDTYSTAITLPFNFPLFGVPYSSLVVSTNGYLSFDATLAGSGAPWNLSSGDVPNTAYAGALVMGPWHDLDPTTSIGTSPNQQIKYNVVGTAPTRKWVLSFYKVPLFSTTCNPLIENTHQIVLHEGTGIIEVFIFDKQQCPTWNSGKAMVGLQNMAKTIGIMPIGRRASDPPWGSIGMNEVWRFYPSGGSTLYRSVQLLDGTGAVVATGDTTRIDANTFSTTFPNVCPAAVGNSIYVVKTTYQRFDDPANTIYSLDTINVDRITALPLTAIMSATTCGASTGSITISASGTPGYQYSLDGGALQTSPTFNGVSAGMHHFYAIDNTGCNNTDSIFVSSVSSLPSTLVSANCTCPGRSDGSISVTPTLGTAPFVFTITGTGTVPGPITNPTSATFSALSAGTYTINFVDNLGCAGTVGPITISAGTSISTTYSSNYSCPGLNNGSATVTATSGTGPYTFTMAGYTGVVTPVPPASATFSGLAAPLGFTPYVVTVTDQTGCSGSRNVYIYEGSGITGTATSTQATCPSVSNGTITATPTSGSGPYTYSLDGGPFVPSVNATYITIPGVSSGSHTVTIKDVSGCTGDVTPTVNAGSGITASATFTATSCSTATNGTILVTSNGTAPLTYSLDGGAYQPAASATATFINVSSGLHNITVKDNLGCMGTTAVTVTAGPVISGTFVQSPTSCPGVFDGSLTVTVTVGTAPFRYSLDGGPLQNGVNPNNYTFNNVSSGTHIVTIRDNFGCEGPVFTVVVPGPGLSASTSNSNPPCANIADGTITIIPSAPGSYTYTLNPLGPNPITQPNPTFTGLGAGTYPFLITSTVSGCQGSSTTALTTNPPITTTVNLTMPLCHGGTDGIISLTPSGGVPSYEFSIDAGINYQAANSFNTVSQGSHTIRIKDNVGCTKDTTVLLNEPTLLTASATSTPGGCAGNDGHIYIVAADGTPSYTYSINNGISFQVPDSFKVSGGNYPDIKVKDANGCVTGTSVIVDLIDDMWIIPINDTTICVEDSVRLIPNISPDASVFHWSSIPNASLSNTLSDSTIKTPYAMPTDTTTYTFQGNWGICHREDTITVRVLHKPIPNAGNDMTVCNYKRDTVLVGSVSDTSGSVNYNWTPANTCTTPDQHITVANPDSTQIYTLTVTDNYGCDFSVTDFVKVIVQPPVPAYAGRDTIAVIGVPLQLMATGGNAYEWNPYNFLDNSNVYNPRATITDDQLFTVIVTAGQCLGFDSVFVRAYAGPAYYTPSSFTPNGDGLNDVFRAIPAGIDKTEYFRVYNRYGQLIFQTNKWLKGWDGTFQGRKQPSGTYVWMAKYSYLDPKDNKYKTEEKQGTVLLIN